MTPLETMAAAYTINKYRDRGAWGALNDEAKSDIIGNMRIALVALSAADLPDAAKRAGRPHRGGEELAEGLFRAVLREITEMER